MMRYLAIHAYLRHHLKQNAVVQLRLLLRHHLGVPPPLSNWIIFEQIAVRYSTAVLPLFTRSTGEARMNHY